jgi:glycine cleavage system H protein
MNIPVNLKYTKDHEWVNIDGDTATVGITDFAKKELEILFMLKLKLRSELDKDGFWYR